MVERNERTTDRIAGKDRSAGPKHRSLSIDTIFSGLGEEVNGGGSGAARRDHR